MALLRGVSNGFPSKSKGTVGSAFAVVGAQGGMRGQREAIVRRTARVIAIVSAFALVFGIAGISLAATHHDTTLVVNVNPDPPVEPGTLVRIVGTLESDYAPCTKHMDIVLRVQGDLVDRDATNGHGRYRFGRVELDETMTFVVKFAGEVLGTHPNQHICDASKARIRIRVA